jgi:hypothetical protein
MGPHASLCSLRRWTTIAFRSRDGAVELAGNGIAPRNPKSARQRIVEPQGDSCRSGRINRRHARQNRFIRNQGIVRDVE